MSDPTGRSTPRTGRGARPSLLEQEGDERPLEFDVTGSIEGPRGGLAEYAVSGGGIDVRQLALELASHLKPPEIERPMFGELVDSWLIHIRTKRVEPANEERLARRLMPLFVDDERSLTVAMVAELIDAQTDLSASTKNKLRGVGRMVIDFAQAEQKWERPNPFALVKRNKEGRRKYELLSIDELYRVQLHLEDNRLRLFRCAVHLGMRPGELMGLRVADIDFPNNLIHVRVSRERDTTKTGEPRDIPLHPAVLTDLLDACVAAKGELVFGHAADGSMESQNLKLTRILRTAMVKADVGVMGGDYKCRRKGCGYSATRLGPIDRRQRSRCPQCDMKLWVVAIVRPVRWYDLRHCCATLHHEHGADRVCVSMALGHSLEGITEEIYTHPSATKMMLELTRWKIAKPPRSVLNNR